MERSSRSCQRLLLLVLASLCLVLGVVSHAAAQGIAVNAVTVGGSGKGAISSLSFSHTVSGSNTLLVVGFTCTTNGSNSVSYIRYNGVNLTRLTTAQRANNAWSELWYMLNPPAGSGTVSMSMGKCQPLVGAISFTGVNQTTPFGTPASATGSSTSPSVTVSSAPGELVIDTVGWDNGTSAGGTAGPSQTQQWNSSNVNDKGAGSIEAGASSVTMSWTLSGSRTWAIGAVSMKPAPPAAPTNLMASAVSSSEIALTWTDVSTELAYRLERKTGAGGTYAQIADLPAGTTTYQDTGLAANTTYYYRVYAYNAGGNSAYSNEASATTSTAYVVADFNVVEPGANAITGKIYTKIAGQNFVVDVMALDASNNVMTTFTGTVAVEVVDGTSGAACASLPAIATLTNQTFVSGDAGRHRLSTPNTVSNAYRNARFRVKSPATSPTLIRCSGDNFAIRPNALSFTVTDADRKTAGTARTLNNTAFGGIVHNVGQPLQITASAYNGAGTPAVTSNYDGSPTAVTTPCGTAACLQTIGTSSLATGTWTASGGTVSTTTASSCCIGAFYVQLQDATFAAVDTNDGSSAAQRTISSTATAVGRFVPDHFVVSAMTIADRSDLPSCATPGFTYMGEPFTATFTLTAVGASGATNTNYADSTGFARLDLASPASFSFGAIDGTRPLTSRVNTSGGTTGSWVSGVANVTAILSLNRNVTPDGPYENFAIGIAPSDLDGVTVDTSALDLDADNNGTSERAQLGTTAVRFGRLRLQNALGSSLIALPIPISAQYWNGSGFVTNTDDSCTSVSAANVALGNYQKNLNAGETTVTAGGTFAAGVGLLRLSAPGASNNGSVDVSVNVGNSGAGASCTAGMPATTALGQQYLQGTWCGTTYTRDPTARATFGLFRNALPIVHWRENY